MSRLIDADALWMDVIRSMDYCEDILEIIERQPTIEERKTEWIPCSERLPESDERVLVYTVANEYHVWDAMTHRGQDYAWEDEEGLYHNLYEVEMWMPLPEPYKEDTDE